MDFKRVNINTNMEDLKQTRLYYKYDMISSTLKDESALSVGWLVGWVLKHTNQFLWK